MYIDSDNFTRVLKSLRRIRPRPVPHPSQAAHGGHAAVVVELLKEHRRFAYREGRRVASARLADVPVLMDFSGIGSLGAC